MVQLLAAQSQQLSATASQIQANTGKAVENSKEVNQVTGFIREISEQTNLLGLNAAIEAARVGEAGAGFGVVASEVRKLSVDTKNATQNIESSLGSVQQSILQMEREISAVADSSTEQARLVNEFSELVDKLNSVSHDFKNFMEVFLNSRL
ncbi:methyl-accepting chemotaxis protein [Paenibacillus hunanensis]|nr:methyl-accepting chemotaxis protein [Paenibacillus hunanensis]